MSKSVSIGLFDLARNFPIQFLDMKEQRSFKNYFKAANYSANNVIGIFCIFMLIVSLLLAYAMHLIYEFGVLVMQAQGLPAVTAGDLQTSIKFIGLHFAIIFVAVVIFTLVYVFIYSQRIGGPMISICKALDQLKSGNYKLERNLRRNDELEPIMSRVLDLARILQKGGN